MKQALAAALDSRPVASSPAPLALLALQRSPGGRWARTRSRPCCRRLLGSSRSCSGAALACTPRSALRLERGLRIRKLLGLLLLLRLPHFLTYAVLDQGLDFGAIMQGHHQAHVHPAGDAPPGCCCCRSPSPPRRAGAADGLPPWKRLHRLVYVAGGHRQLPLPAALQDPADRDALAWMAVIAVAFAARLAYAAAPRAGCYSPGECPAPSVHPRRRRRQHHPPEHRVHPRARAG